jgi:hypothetical protein
MTRLPDIDPQIGVANRDYHRLSQSEIAGGKRIYQQLSGREPVAVLLRWLPMIREPTYLLRNEKEREKGGLLPFGRAIRRRRP